MVFTKCMFVFFALTILLIMDYTTAPDPVTELMNWEDDCSGGYSYSDKDFDENAGNNKPPISDTEKQRIRNLRMEAFKKPELKSSQRLEIEAYLKTYYSMVDFSQVPPLPAKDPSSITPYRSSGRSSQQRKSSTGASSSTVSTSGNSSSNQFQLKIVPSTLEGRAMFLNDPTFFCFTYIILDGYNCTPAENWDKAFYRDKTNDQFLAASTKLYVRQLATVPKSQAFTPAAFCEALKKALARRNIRIVVE